VLAESAETRAAGCGRLTVDTPWLLDRLAGLAVTVSAGDVKGSPDACPQLQICWVTDQRTRGAIMATVEVFYTSRFDLNTLLHVKFITI
jgi:hypothetical protein